MLRRLMMVLAVAVGFLAPGVARADNPNTDTIKIGTLAPGESPWGQVFKVWKTAVRERTKFPEGGKSADGNTYALDLTFFWNGQQGDEAAMVGKMQSGQLDGAAITSVGLAKIHRPILVMQMPGLFRDWSKLDNARNALKGDFEKALFDAGFTLTGWGDVGLARTFSKGFQVNSPADFKGKNPYMWRDDPIMPVLFQVIGGVTGVPLGVPEVLPNLNSGAVNIVTVPALVAEQLQWASRLDSMNENVAGCAIGALVLTNKKLDALAGDQKQILIDTGKVAGAALTNRIRNEDNAAFGRLKGKMNTYAPTEAQINEWKTTFATVRQRLAQGTFPADLVARVEGLAK